MENYRRHAEFVYVEGFELITKFLRDGANSPAMNVNGSVTAVEFDYTAPTGYHVLLEGFRAVILDNAVCNGEDFGAIAGPLTNGIQIDIRNGSNVQQADLLDGQTIKRNGDWGNLTGGRFVQLGGDHGYVFEWNLTAIGGVPVKLPEDHKVVWKINDDLTPLVSFKVTAIGSIIDKTIRHFREVPGTDA